MIGKLKGIIDEVAEDHVLIDVGGIGYTVFCSVHTLRNIPGKGEAAVLLIETHVREDHIHLYGFAEAIEKKWFSILTGVNGVGTRMALAILSVLTPSQIIAAVASQDKAAFTQVSGVGPKLADRLLTELKNKAKPAEGEVVSIAPGVVAADSSGNIADAISALTNLGYNRSEAYTAITRIAGQNDNADTAKLITLGLKELGT